MRVFISINNLNCGGAQKSLLSFLNGISSDENINIDLCVLNESDAFFEDIPEYIHRLKASNEIKAIFLSIKDLMNSKLPITIKLKGIIAKFLLKLPVQGDSVQRLWKAWKAFIPKQEGYYDLAVSYVDGFSNYYVVDKVISKKKILWIHNEYEKLSYYAEYDRNYFAKANALITISEECVESLKHIFPEFTAKIKLLYNISSSEMIWKMSAKYIPPEYAGKKNIIISIGRLNEQKGFDLAIRASRILNSWGVDFDWYIIGEGEIREQLTTMIEGFGLEQKVHLLGLRKNPYPYIRYADLFVQPSRYEGKSIVLDEAKILYKPIIATDYDTVYDSLRDGNNGTICSFDEDDLANSICDLLNNPEKKNSYSENLSRELNNKTTAGDYIKLFRSI